jgi:outer membrane protein W
MPPKPTHRSPQVRAGRALRPLLLAPLLGLLLALGAAPARAREGDSRAGLFVGTTTYAVQNYTTFGVAFGGSYGYEFSDDYMWTLGATFASTSGQATDSAGNPVDLQTSTAELRTGLVTFFNRGPRSTWVPYVGAGLSLLNYKFDFPGTTVGTTSGNSPGVYGEVGVEIRLSRSVTLIPQFGVAVHSIKTESGTTTGLLSGGLVFTVRLST